MAETKTVILIVDDEPPIRKFLRTALTGLGFKVVEAATGVEGVSLAASHHPNVVLLDLGLPDIDGLEVLRRLRSWSQVPVVILSARDQENDKVAGLESGAADYLTKPFGMKELTSRLKVALRHSSTREEPDNPVLRDTGLEIDLLGRRVLRNGEETHLTPNEWRLLDILGRHPGKLVTQSQLLREVWGPAGGDNTSYLRTYMHQLRKKLENDPARPRWLMTEPGVGYRLRL